MILYGLPTCPDCTAALRAFERADVPLTFRDVRADPLSGAEWAALIAEFGTTLVDTKGQPWRNLSAYLRESEADAQLSAQPALMRRPVIGDGTRWTLGWDEEIRAGWGV